MSFRNRLWIANTNGRSTLSVPVLGGREQRTIMKEVRIANRLDWKSQHWKSLESAYNRSPWFDHYRDSLRELYLKPSDKLIEWNLDCLDWAFRQLGLAPRISLTAAYRKTYDEPGLVDFRDQCRPKNLSSFLPSVYHQVFEEKLGFIPYLSILDLLFCEGPRAREYLASGQVH